MTPELGRRELTGGHLMNSAVGGVALWANRGSNTPRLGPKGCYRLGSRGSVRGKR